MYICICEGVTDKQIKAAIADGAGSVTDLRKELGVASQCGQCGKCAKKLLKECGLESTCPRLSRQVTQPTLMNTFPLLQEATA